MFVISIHTHTYHKSNVKTSSLISKKINPHMSRNQALGQGRGGLTVPPRSQKICAVKKGRNHQEPKLLFCRAWRNNQTNRKSSWRNLRLAAQRLLLFGRFFCSTVPAPSDGSALCSALPSSSPLAAIASRTSRRRSCSDPMAAGGGARRTRRIPTMSRRRRPAAACGLVGRVGARVGGGG
ncbi:hypothetical protein BRADI_2g25879v3 [Brachypodium distachyon]|uniref:Uncharacterized protein n=1 Tax=Brachypodium distachyon TaxID=15368 RepID=A0A2K2DAI7_BRADI|nr:hypothetical protein BRADI_2g25879v3 [Brachypodium distachyon]